MDVLFAALPLRGHVHPLVPLALACRDAGHAVTFAVDASYDGSLPLPRRPEAVLVDAVADLVRAHSDGPALALAGAVLGPAAAVEAAARLAVSLREAPVDLVVHDATDVGAGIAAWLAGVPSIAFNTGHWHPLDSDRALLDPLPASLRVAAPPAVPVLPVRSVGWSDGAGGNLPGRSDRPRVLVTFGTVPAGIDDALGAVRRGLAGLDLNVVEAVDRFVDQPAVLATADLVLHHGGTGTVLGALEHGVPQVVVPQGADQLLNARRLGELGAARVLVGDQVSPGRVREAVTALLDPAAPERAVTGRLRDELVAMPAPADVVPVLATLAAR